jgi:hypothetical protein
MNHIYDAEFHPLIYSSPQPSACKRWIKFFIYLAVMLCMIAFTVTDIVYGCSSTACINQTIQSAPMSLGAWFQFSGMIGCIILVFAIAFGCCWSIPPSLHLILNMIPQILMFSWLLFGNVVYWKGYYQNNTCENGIITYLMIRFYVGFLVIIISVYHEIKSYD